MSQYEKYDGTNFTTRILDSSEIFMKTLVLEESVKYSKIKVLYIAGPVRSGSTILSNILGENDGFFHAGELMDIWDQSLSINGRCGCGVHMSKCEVWCEVLDNLIRTQGPIDIQEMISMRDDAVHSNKVPWRLIVHGTRSKVAPHLKKYINNLHKLYREIALFTNSKVIVDSSKNAVYADILTMIPEIDLYIVHLVRDPRAAVYSSSFRKKEGVSQRSIVSSSLWWNVRNITSEMLQKNRPGKYLRLYYEEFINKPQDTLKHILDLVHENTVHFPFLTENEVKVGTNHSVYGNPNRFQTGDLNLQMDDEWRVMGKLDKIVVTLLTIPLLIRYGYSVVS